MNGNRTRIATTTAAMPSPMNLDPPPFRLHRQHSSRSTWLPVSRVSCVGLSAPPPPGRFERPDRRRRRPSRRRPGRRLQTRRGRWQNRIVIGGGVERRGAGVKVRSGARGPLRHRDFRLVYVSATSPWSATASAFVALPFAVLAPGAARRTSPHHRGGDRIEGPLPALRRRDGGSAAPVEGDDRRGSGPPPPARPAWRR